MTFVRHNWEPELPPPPPSARRSWANHATTIALVLLLAWAIPPVFKALIYNAIWSAPDGTLCRAHPEGVCWAFIAHKGDYFLYGSYPQDQHWRVLLAESVGFGLITWLLWPGAPRRGWALALLFLGFPVLAYVLLSGLPALGLPYVPTLSWGGLLVTWITALVGILASAPLGLMLALGRRSHWPFVQALSVVFIETVRGVPFITVLYMANTMLPLFLPPEINPDRFLRPLVGIALFASAYLAEEIRGGLQALPRGQYEGAQALGLDYWRMMRLVVLPQALEAVIPNIVNITIGIFKDTSLVAVVGMSDFLETIDHAMKDPHWAAPTLFVTGYAFAALFYFAICYGMSRYSAAMERRLKTV